MARALPSFISALGTAVVVAGAAPACAQDAAEAQFGRVHFSTSCNEAAQRRFDRAMRYQHSFWYSQSKEIFEETLAADPECAMAHWGVALSLLYNPHIAPPAQNLAQGLAALQKAKSLRIKTQRERDYIDALLAFYAGDDKVRHGERVQAYLNALEALAQRYPDDDEAQIAYAITLNVAASPHDKTYAYQLKGAAILEPIFQRQPRHPGVAHYLIHLYDYPPIAEKGLDAARRYAEIAPAAPHAQHMPSHIFTRVGYWQESVASNTASARAAKAGKEGTDQLHAMDYMVYAHLQLAQDKEARAVIDEMLEVKGPQSDGARRLLCGRRQPGPLHDRARRLERCRRLQVQPTASPTWMRSRISPARSARRAPASRTTPGPTSPSSPSCATSCATPRTPIGPSRWTSRGRSRPPGCCGPRASTTRRSPPCRPPPTRRTGPRSRSSRRDRWRRRASFTA